MKSLDDGILCRLKVQEDWQHLRVTGDWELSHPISSLLHPGTPRAGPVSHGPVSHTRAVEPAQGFTGFRPPALPESPPVPLQERIRSVGKAGGGATAAPRRRQYQQWGTKAPSRGEGWPLRAAVHFNQAEQAAQDLPRKENKGGGC